MLKRVFLLVFVVNVAWGANIDLKQYYCEIEFKKGFYYFNMQDFELAVFHFKKALEYKPLFHPARYQLARAYYYSGDMDSAISEWNNLVKMGVIDNITLKQLQFEYLRSGIEREFFRFRDYVVTDIITGTKRGDILFSRPCGITIDSSQNLYIVGFRSCNLVKLDMNANNIYDISKAGQKKLKNPYDVIYADGRLYISDFGNDRIVVLKPDGSFVRDIGKSGIGKGELLGPEGMCYTNGYIYVADNGNDRIVKFFTNGNYVMSFDGNKENKLYRPSDIAIFEDELYVADAGNGLVRIFDMYGNYKFSIGKEFLKEPRGIFINSRTKEVFIADRLKGIFSYNINGGNWHYIYNIDANKRFGKRNYLNETGDIVMTDTDIIYATDFGDVKIIELTPQKLKNINLSVRLYRTRINSLPSIIHYITVEDVRGNPIEGLTKNNFDIYDNSKSVPLFDVNVFKKEHKHLSLTIIMDKRSSLADRYEDIRDFMNVLLKSADIRDRVMLIEAGKDASIKIKYTNRKLRLLNAMLDNKFFDEVDFGKAIYLAVKNNMRNEYKKAILIITSGFVESDFSYKDYTSSLYLARNNRVPVYIVSFSKWQDSRLMKDMCKKTFGRYYSFVRNAESVYHLYNDILMQSIGLYKISYNIKIDERAKREVFREFKVVVRYKSFYGTTKQIYAISYK